jgi:hypothetical protein
MIKRLFVGRSSMARPLSSVSMAAKATIQELVSEAAFHASSLGRGIPLSQDAAESLHSLMRRIPISDLGFDASSVRDPHQATIRGFRLGERKGQNLCYYDAVFEDSEVTIGIFCLPAHASLPIHDHPGMTVLSRLLFGTLKVKSYDLLSNESSSGKVGDRIKVKKSVETTVQGSTSEASLSLFPTLGNVHEFQAVSPCAILDILMPPYSPPKYDCTYYREIVSEEEGGHATLEVIPEPPDFKVKNLKC